MGLRIHKMLGYGLVDIVESDPRINWDSPVFRYELDGNRYINWLDRFELKDLGVNPRLYGDGPGLVKPDVQSCFQFGTEDSGSPSVLCIRPLAWRDWYRFDDSIDYVEQTESEEGQRDTFQVLNHGIYPHISYMDDRLGYQIKGSDAHAWQRAKNALKGNLPDDTSVLDDLARLAGFESHQDALLHCRPHVPNEVRYLAAFSGVFTSAETHTKLRPMIYTWWG